MIFYLMAVTTKHSQEFIWFICEIATWFNGIMSTNQQSFFPTMTKIVGTLGPSRSLCRHHFHLPQGQHDQYAIPFVHVVRFAGEAKAWTNVFEMPTPWMLEMAWQSGEMWSWYKKSSWVSSYYAICSSALCFSVAVTLWFKHLFLTRTHLKLEVMNKY
jgi:hypothetical protein